MDPIHFNDKLWRQLTGLSWFGFAASIAISLFGNYGAAAKAEQARIADGGSAFNVAEFGAYMVPVVAFAVATTVLKLMVAAGVHRWLPTALTWVMGIGLVVVAAASAVQSFDHLTKLAEGALIHPHIAPLFPVVVDGMGLVCSVALLGLAFAEDVRHRFQMARQAQADAEAEARRRDREQRAALQAQADAEQARAQAAIEQARAETAKAAADLERAAARQTAAVADKAARTTAAAAGPRAALPAGGNTGGQPAGDDRYRIVAEALLAGKTAKEAAALVGTVDRQVRRWKSAGKLSSYGVTAEWHNDGAAVPDSATNGNHPDPDLETVAGGAIAQ